MRILVVEDDRKIASFITMGLQQAGFAVDHAANAEDALDLTQTEPYDVAVVDIMLPGMDSLAMIEALRRNKMLTPVLILSAKRGRSWSRAGDGAADRPRERRRERRVRGADQDGRRSDPRSQGGCRHGRRAPRGRRGR